MDRRSLGPDLCREVEIEFQVVAGSGCRYQTLDKGRFALRVGDEVVVFGAQFALQSLVLPAEFGPRTEHIARYHAQLPPIARRGEDVVVEPLTVVDTKDRVPLGGVLRSITAEFGRDRVGNVTYGVVRDDDVEIDDVLRREVSNGSRADVFEPSEPAFEAVYR